MNTSKENWTLFVLIWRLKRQKFDIYAEFIWKLMLSFIIWVEALSFLISFLLGLFITVICFSMSFLMFVKGASNFLLKRSS